MTLDNLITADGAIDISAGGTVYADNVRSFNGVANNDITIATSSGHIEVDQILVAAPDSGPYEGLVWLTADTGSTSRQLPRPSVSEDLFSAFTR